MKRYELIKKLTAVYFGQDYDYLGETGAEIMAEYRKACTPRSSISCARTRTWKRTSCAGSSALAQPEDFGSTMREFLEHVRAALK